MVIRIQQFQVIVGHLDFLLTLVEDIIIIDKELQVQEGFNLQVGILMVIQTVILGLHQDL
mgnify:CR=1 FL=1